MNRCVTAGLLLCLLAVGCNDAPAESAAAAGAEADSAFSLLQQMERSDFYAAFDRLGEHAHTRRIQTTQFNPEGEVTATRYRIVRYPAGASAEVRELASGADGTFQFGYLDGFAGASDEPVRVTIDSAFAGNILPDELPFLMPRHREGFTYSLPGDAMTGGQPARVVEVQRRSEYADRYAIERARFYLAGDSHQLREVRVWRTNETSFFDEQTLLYARLQPAGNAWLPGVTRVRTTIRMPLHPARRFQTVTEFSDFQM